MGSPSPFPPVDAVVLAGGLGTRLREAVPDLPKPLAPVGGRPFLDLVLRNLGPFPGLRRVVLAIGYRAEQVVEAYRERDDLPFPLSFSVEPSPMGTGGAVALALGEARTEEIVVLNGDSLAEADWGAFRRFHASSSSPFTMLLREVEDPGRFGRVVTDGAGRIVSFEEKRQGAPPGPINAGVYLLRRSLVERRGAAAPWSLERDLVPALLAEGTPLYGFPTEGRFIDIGLPESWRSAEAYLKDHLEKGGT